MTRWFTADHHYGHTNIIKYCKRPFYYVHDMNKTMTERWNEVVKPEDTVYHLGDFGLSGKMQMNTYLERLNGYKILIRGNHDKGVTRMLEFGFNEVFAGDITIELAGQTINVSHYPYLNETDGTDEKGNEYVVKYKERRPINDGRWLLCGHIHEKWKQLGKMINVGVDVWDFYPVHEDTLVEIISAFKST